MSEYGARLRATFITSCPTCHLSLWSGHVADTCARDDSPHDDARGAAHRPSGTAGVAGVRYAQVSASYAAVTSVVVPETSVTTTSASPAASAPRALNDW